MSNLPYRQGANAFVVDDKGNYLIVNKQSYGAAQWDVPGGGLEKNESPESGILRELKEELGTDKFELLEKSNIIHRFDWPRDAQERSYKKTGVWYRGQEKHQFLVRFTGDKSEITPQEEEIRQVKWVPYEQLKDHLVFEGQWATAEKTIQSFSQCS